MKTGRDNPAPFFMKLSVLICSLPDRDGCALRSEKIYEQLLSQLTDEVQLISLYDNWQMSIGEKRNHLLKLSKGKYTVYVDDDDEVSPYYISELLKATETDVDVINFKVSFNKTGQNIPVHYSIYNKNEKKGIYFRRPNHLMAIKTCIAQKVGFEDINMGEDTLFADKILPYLKTEHQINNTLYYYQPSISEACKRSM